MNLELIEEKLKDEFKKIEKQEEANSIKILNAFREEKVSETDFNSTTGYGYNDLGRDKLERVFSRVLGSEDALVRSQFISGSHALTVTLFALLRPGDTLLSISSKPYDTLDEVIGIRENKSSLKSFNINYKQVDLIDNDFDYEKIKDVITSEKIKVIEIQRSKGYSTRASLNIEKINSVIKFIKDINKDIIIDYLKKIDNLSNKSISAILSSLRCFYNYLLDNKMIEVNYFKLISNPKLEKKLPTFLSYEDIRKVIDSIEETDTLSIRNKMIIELLYATGIRVSELKNIKIKDINFSEKSIKVMGKGSKERIVFFNNHSLIAINKYLENRGFNNDYLVLNNKGKEITVRGIELIIKNVIDKACLKVHVSPHTFRHTFATHMLSNGCPLKSVQELLGHASLSSTEIYTHITDDYIKSEYLKNMPRR